MDDFVNYDIKNGIILVRNSDMLYLIFDGGIDYTIMCCDAVHSLELFKEHKDDLMNFYNLIPSMQNITIVKGIA